MCTYIQGLRAPYEWEKRVFTPFRCRLAGTHLRRDPMRTRRADLPLHI
jgi:hypothetical protein